MGINDRFGGVYAKDEIKTGMIKPNYFYIINLDDYNSPQNGTHWTAFYYHNKKIEYFDSYGLPPPELISKNYPYIYITAVNFKDILFRVVIIVYIIFITVIRDLVFIKF